MRVILKFGSPGVVWVTIFLCNLIIYNSDKCCPGIKIETKEHSLIWSTPSLGQRAEQTQLLGLSVGSVPSLEDLVC